MILGGTTVGRDVGEFMLTGGNVHLLAVSKNEAEMGNE